MFQGSLLSKFVHWLRTLCGENYSAYCVTHTFYCTEDGSLCVLSFMYFHRLVQCAFVLCVVLLFGIVEFNRVVLVKWRFILSTIIMVVTCEYNIRWKRETRRLVVFSFYPNLVVYLYSKIIRKRQQYIKINKEILLKHTPSFWDLRIPSSRNIFWQLPLQKK